VRAASRPCGAWRAPAEARRQTQTLARGSARRPARTTAPASTTCTRCSAAARRRRRPARS
jgi:hypothetical protein